MSDISEKLQLKLEQGRTYRSMELAIKEDEDEKECRVEGYASTFDEPYKLWEKDDIEVWERVDRKAFDDCDMADVIMQYDHEGRVFARKSNDTLIVTPDERGLHISAILGGTEIGRQLYEEIKGGYTNKMSFGFTVSEDRQDVTKDESGKRIVLRTITGISKLYDVSAVSLPANDATSISARSFSEGVIEEVKQELLRAEEEERSKERQKQKIRILCEVENGY